MQKRKNIWRVMAYSLIVAAIVSACTIAVSAYYMSRVYLYTDDAGGKQLFRVGMELNTFFDEINSGVTTGGVAEFTPLGIVCTDIGVVTEGTEAAVDSEKKYSSVTADGNTYYVNNTSDLSVKVMGSGSTATYEYVYNSDADWGSASNPYIISRINHLQNLYVLQNLGFFTTYFTVDSYGNPQGTEENMPYFLVCTNTGTPVTIDGTNMIFEHIGNSANPFIGYLGGAFATGETTVNGQKSSQSAIYNLTVQSDGDAVDIGLFGAVGYLGTPSADATAGSTFSGAVSTIRDFLLYDVRVKVKDKTLWEAVVDKAAHLFSFSSVADDNLNSVPHETHHIGILAGHVEYATIEYISVYYSGDDIPAIDVDKTTKSTQYQKNADGSIAKDESGNPIVTASVSANFYSSTGILGYVLNMNSEQANGTVTIGGTGSDDMVVSAGGDGSGGGLLSGEGRGYVTAAEIFNSYSDSGKIVKMTTGTKDNPIVKYGLLVQLHDVQTQISYVKENGTLINPNGTEDKTNVTLADGTPVSFASDFSYVTTYSVSYNFWGIAEVETQKWYNYIVHDTTVAEGDPNEYYYFVSGNQKVYGTKSNITRTGISLKYAAAYDSDAQKWDNLCTQYIRERVGSTYTGLIQTTDRYYFYDGVFTFSLSDSADTIEETWVGGDVGKIVVGENDDDSWTQDNSGLPNSIVAFIKPVTTVGDLQDDKEIFIAYKEVVTETVTDGNGNIVYDEGGNEKTKEVTKYHIVTLEGNSNYNSGQGDNAVTTLKTTLELADDDLTVAIGEALTDGTLEFEPANARTTSETLKADWDDIQVLNLGSLGNTSLSLEELKSHYQVKVSYRAEEPFKGYYEDDGTTPIAEANLPNLQLSAKQDTTGTYYSIASVSDIIDTEDSGVDILYFTLVGTTTVKLNSIQNAVNTSNSVYTSLESGKEDTVISISDIQSAINTRNSKYYDANGTETLASVVQDAINSRNSKYYNAAGTETLPSVVQDAIDARNETYYNLEAGKEGTVANTDAIQDTIETVNNNYYALGSDSDGSAIKDASKIQKAITNINTPYYWMEGVSNQNAVPAYFKLIDSRKTANLSAVANAISGIGGLYEDDSATSVSSAMRSNMQLSSSGDSITQTETETYNGYFYFWTEDPNVHSSAAISWTYRLFYVDATGTQVDTISGGGIATGKKKWNQEWDEVLYGMFNSHNTVTGLDGKNITMVTGKNAAGTVVTLPLLYELSGTYYREYSRGGNSQIQGTSGTNVTFNAKHLFYTTGNRTYNYILETVSAASTTYTWCGTGTSCSAPTESSTTISSIVKDDSKRLYGRNFKLYSCDLGKNAILLVRYITVNGTFIETTTGSGIVYSFTTSSSCGTPTAVTGVAGTTIMVDGTARQLYRDGTHLGVMVANFRVDGIMLKSLSGGGGTTYSLVNGSYTTIDTWNGSATEWDIGQNVTADGITYKIYRGTDGRLGVLAENNIIDGILLQTLTGNGYNYFLISAQRNADGTRNVLQLTDSAYTVTGNMLKVNGVTYQLCIRNNKLGVRIEKEQLDGIMLKTLTGNGYTYTLIDGKTEGAVAGANLNGTFSDTFASLPIEKTLTVNGVTYTVYANNGHLGVCLENERLDGIMLKTLTGNGYKYSLINGTTEKVIPNTSLTSSFHESFTASFAMEKTLTANAVPYTVYANNGYLGVCLENEYLDGILLKSLTGHGDVYTLISGSGAKLADVTDNFTNISGIAHYNVEKTLTVGGNTYVIYSNNGKLGVKAQNFVIDGIIIQTQTGTGVEYSLFNGSSAVALGDGITFTQVSGRSITADDVTHQVYLSSDKHYCVRAANIETDGYALASVISGSPTKYNFIDRAGNDIILASAPQQLPGLMVSLSDGSEIKSYNLYVCEGKLGIELIHIDNGQTYYYTFWHEGNSGSSNEPYYLRLLRRAYTLGSPKYSMICATDSRVEDNDTNLSFFGTWIAPCRSLRESTDCTVIFNDDGSVYLQYTVSGETRYLSYSTTGDYFTSSSSQSSAAKLYLFTSEGTHEATIGEQMIPLYGTEQGTYSADEYVLWPNQVYDSTDTTTTVTVGEDGNEISTTVNNTEDYNPANGYALDTSYSVKSLADLYNEGWMSRDAKQLNSKDINTGKSIYLGSVFSLGQGISSVTMLNLWGGNTGTSFGKDNYVKAPIGTTGEEAYIPTGCVAFRVNKNLASNKIRVIVAVPISEYYYGETENDAVTNPSATELDYSEDYFFCMWKIDEANASTSYSISENNCHTAFELPRSTPYNPMDYTNQYYSAISDNDYSVSGTGNVKKYINVTMGDDTYRAYLNGDQVLVAYEFEASEVGVYLLGSTKECRIVYFSADSTASGGKDGVISQKVGTIDFVYDNGDYSIGDDGLISGTAGKKILTIRDTNKGAIAVSDYSLYYYASLDLLYTDNTAAREAASGDTDGGTYPNINNFIIYVRRVATHDSTTGGYSTVCWQVGNYGEGTSLFDAVYIKMAGYADGASGSDPISQRTSIVVSRMVSEPESESESESTAE